MPATTRRMSRVGAVPPPDLPMTVIANVETPKRREISRTPPVPEQSAIEETPDEGEEMDIPEDKVPEPVPTPSLAEAPPSDNMPDQDDETHLDPADELTAALITAGLAHLDSDSDEDIHAPEPEASPEPVPAPETSSSPAPAPEPASPTSSSSSIGPKSTTSDSDSDSSDADSLPAFHLSPAPKKNLGKRISIVNRPPPPPSPLFLARNHSIAMPPASREPHNYLSRSMSVSMPTNVPQSTYMPQSMTSHSRTTQLEYERMLVNTRGQVQPLEDEKLKVCTYRCMSVHPILEHVRDAQGNEVKYKDGTTMQQWRRNQEGLIESCGALVEIKRGDTMACREWHGRVLAKVRTNRMVQFDGR